MSGSAHAVRIAGILSLFLCGALIRIGDSDTTYHMEVLSLEPAQESWLRAHAGEEGAWGSPTMYGEPRLRKPPMLYWVTELAWTGLTPENSTVDDRVERARWASIALGALAIVAVYGLGRILGGDRVAWLGALALAVTVATYRQGRMATYDAHLFAWAAMAAGLGIAAMAGRDGKGLGWAVAPAGLCAACAAMTKGPIAFLFVGPPLLLAYGLLSTHGRRDALRLLAVFAFAAGLTSLWYHHVFLSYANAADTFTAEYQTSRLKSKPPWYYVGLLGMVFPWTLALVGGLWMAFKRRAASPAVRMVLIWFVLVLVVMSIPGPKRQRYIYPLFPAAALLIGFWWDALCRGDLPEAWTRLFSKAHGIVMAGAGIGMALFLVLEPSLVRQGVLEQAELPGVPAWAAVLAGGLFVVNGLGVGQMLKRRFFGRAAVLTALLVSLAMTFAMGFYVDSHHGAYPDRAEAEAFRGRIDDLYVGQLVLDTDAPSPMLDKKFLMYGEFIPKRRTPEALEAAPFRWVVCPDDVDHPRWLEKNGWEPVFSFTEAGAGWQLFERARMP